jgi:uncharacterized protein with ParB-like and HNH nuclease domain
VEARETTFETLLNGRVQYRVPLFQRQYAWERAQREQLWSDVVDLHEERRAGDHHAQHFMGSIVTAPEQLGPNRPATHTLIDGQQRMTTLNVLLAALRDHVAEADGPSADRIDGLYLRNQYPQEPLDDFKVLPTQRDRDEFAALIRVEPDTQTSPGLRQSYRYFRERLRREQDADGDPLDPALLEDTLLQGLGVVSITLGPNDNAYRVFESLNATGLRLRQIDLIRNLFMMKLGVAQAEDVYTNIWLPMQDLLGENFEAFANDYYVKDGTFLRADATYTHAKAKLDGSEGAQVVPALEDMAWFAERWARIHRPNRETDVGLRDALLSMNRFGADTPYPFLLNVYEARDRHGTASSAQMTQIVSMIEGFLVRRMFLNVPTNQLNRLFIRLWDQLPHEGDIVDEVRAALAEPSRRWPNDDEFREAVSKYPLYSDSRPGQRRLVLDRLEQSYGHQEVVALDELQIEHIIPQTLTDDWRAMLGEGADQVWARWKDTPANLTLTGYNPELSNSSWPDKRAFYAASHVSMTRELAELDTFDEAALRVRGAELAERAIGLWPGPTH